MKPYDWHMVRKARAEAAIASLEPRVGANPRDSASALSLLAWRKVLRVSDAALAELRAQGGPDVPELPGEAETA